DAHPQARPLRAGIDTMIPLKYYGIQAETAAHGLTDDLDPSRDTPDQLRKLGPQPGWSAMSVYRLHDPTGRYAYFLRCFQPVEMIGYSIYIYHITPEEANRVRQQLGLPLL